MSLMILLRVLHLFGAILWIGGVTAVALAAAAFSSEARKDGLPALRGALVKLATPGMLLAWGGGLGMLIPYFGEVYARAGWMHAKLLFVFLASGLTGAITGAIRKAALGKEELAAGKVRGLGLALATLGLLVIFMVLARPF